MSDSWREVLRAQQDDLKALQRSAGVSNDDDDLDADIERLLKRPPAPSWLGKSKANESQSLYDDEARAPLDDDLYADAAPAEAFPKNNARPSSSKSRPSSGKSRPSSHSAVAQGQARASESPPRPGSPQNGDDLDGDGNVDAVDSLATPKGAPDAAARFQKAKIKMLTRQLEDAMTIRKKVDEQLGKFTGKVLSCLGFICHCITFCSVLFCVQILCPRSCGMSARRAKV